MRRTSRKRCSACRQKKLHLRTTGKKRAFLLYVRGGGRSPSLAAATVAECRAGVVIDDDKAITDASLSGRCHDALSSMPSCTYRPHTVDGHLPSPGHLSPWDIYPCTGLPFRTPKSEMLSASHLLLIFLSFEIYLIFKLYY